MDDEEEYDEYRVQDFAERAVRSNERTPGQMSEQD